MSQEAEVNHSVEITNYHPVYDSILQKFKLPRVQAQYTAFPIEMIEIANDDPSRNPVVILADSHPVGFFVLQTGERVESYSDNPNSLLLIAYLIDYVHQGKGFAKASLQLLPEFVRNQFPEINEVVLAVNEKNKAAQRLYKKCGFEDRGIRKMGEIGMQQILFLDVI